MKHTNTLWCRFVFCRCIKCHHHHKHLGHLWTVPSLELELLAPTLLRSSNCSPPLWSLVEWFKRDSVLWHSLQVWKPVPSVFIITVLIKLLYIHVAPFRIISIWRYRPLRMSLLGLETSPEIILWKCFRQLQRSFPHNNVTAWRFQ